MFKLFGITPCEALMRGTLEHNPWLVLELLAQVSRNTLCVLVEGQRADAAVAAAASSSSKKSKAAGSKGKAAGSKRGSGDGVVVVLQPPKQEALWKVVQPPVNMAAGEGQEEEEGEAGAEGSVEEEEEGDSVFDWFDSDVTSEQGEDAGPAADPLQHAAAAAAAGIDAAAGDGPAAALGCSRVTHLVLKLRNNSWKLLPVTSGICTQPGVGGAAALNTAGSHGSGSSSKRQRVSLGGPVSGGSSSTKGRGSGSGSVLQVGVSGPNANYSFCIVCDSREGLVACSTCHVSVCEAHCSSQLTVPMGPTWRCTACCKRGK
jgi:hypothetical protein